MLQRLLRLFSFVREMELSEQRLRAALQEMTTEKLILQDRLDSALTERTKVWDLAQEAIQAERTSYQMHINVQWQKQGWGRPHPEAPGIPERSVQRPAEDASENFLPRPALGSEAVRTRTKQFIQEFVENTKNSVRQ